MTDFFKLAGNLLTLEVSTVLKDGMSAQKMPPSAQAVLDVVQDYQGYLCRQALLFGPLGRPLPPWAEAQSASFDMGLQPFPLAAAAEAGGNRAVDARILLGEPTDVSRQALQALSQIALWLGEMRQRVLAADSAEAAEVARRLRPGDDAVLDRIRRNCDQLQPLVGAALITPASRLTLRGEDIVLLRKVWELGTEVVVMQTVIQIDGDVVTRVQPGRAGNQDATLHTVHNDAVAISFRQWSFLVRTLGQMAGVMVRTLLR